MHRRTTLVPVSGLYSVKIGRMELDIKGNLACQGAWISMEDERLAVQFLAEAEPQVLSLAARVRRILDTLVANKTISHMEITEITWCFDTT